MHEHRWGRMPVTDFTVTYKCLGCPEMHKVRWGWTASSAGEVDHAIMEAHGGIVHGEYELPVPFSSTLPGRVLQVKALGLSLYLEEILDPPDDEDF
jgi:hypothetical protein